EGNPRGANVMGKDAAELIVPDFADERGARSERCRAHDGICRRAARDLHGRSHGVVECRGFGRIDQPHRTLVHFLSDQEIVLRARNHIDDRIADAEHVEARCRHEGAPSAQTAGNIAIDIAKGAFSYFRSPAASAALRHMTRSRAMSCANSSGEPPNGSNPCARSLAPTPSDASAALAAAARFSTSGRGVPAGATRPNQTSVAKSGNPDSASVGRFGAMCGRLAEAEAR